MRLPRLNRSLPLAACLATLLSFNSPPRQRRLAAAHLAAPRPQPRPDRLRLRRRPLDRAARRRPRHPAHHRRRRRDRARSSRPTAGPSPSPASTTATPTSSPSPPPAASPTASPTIPPPTSRSAGRRTASRSSSAPTATPPAATPRSSPSPPRAASPPCCRCPWPTPASSRPTARDRLHPARRPPSASTSPTSSPGATTAAARPARSGSPRSPASTPSRCRTRPPPTSRPSASAASVYFLSGRDRADRHLPLRPGQQGRGRGLCTTPAPTSARSPATAHADLRPARRDLHSWTPPAASRSSSPSRSTPTCPTSVPHLKNVAAEIDHVAISPTGLRAAVEAHGEILTVPVKNGPIRNLTNTPGVMEREPAWSPDGQSIAYFSDESGLYALHVVAQTGGGAGEEIPARPRARLLLLTRCGRRTPRRSPSTTTACALCARHRHRQAHHRRRAERLWRLLRRSHGMAWSPDSKWLAYPRSMPNHLHAMLLYSVDTGQSTQVTDADGRRPLSRPSTATASTSTSSPAPTPAPPPTAWT